MNEGLDKLLEHHRMSPSKALKGTTHRHSTAAIGPGVGGATARPRRGHCRPQLALARKGSVVVACQKTADIEQLLLHMSETCCMS